jgi:hypothetical protein
LADDAAELGDRRPEVGQQEHFRERRRREIRRQARMLGGIVNDRLRHFLDDVEVRGRTHELGNADALAALHQDVGERERHDEGAVEFAPLRERGREVHRWRTVGP